MARSRLRSPLPQRHGLDAVRLRTPDDGTWASMRDHLVERLPRVEPARVDALLADGRIVGVDGPIAPDAPYAPRTFLWFHRDLPVESPVPFPIGIVHRDETLLVVDKPHFLATIPRGRHIVETALVRLRRELDLPELSPAHRLDRATAGLLMFVVRRGDRGAYQTLFRDRRVSKTYEAIARHDPGLPLPVTVRSHIVKDRGVLKAYEIDAPPNAETHVELLEHRAGLARYRLRPTTGRTHQLRLHMAGLGVPILGDDFYGGDDVNRGDDMNRGDDVTGRGAGEPVERALDDFTDPMQLLAAQLAFTDPITRLERQFTSCLRLDRWSDLPS